ncbi:MAG: CoA pyrophosphatase [Spongiibacteraceae bacterium]
MSSLLVETPSPVCLELLRRQLAINTPLTVEGDYTEAAVLVAITVGAAEPEVILTRRAQHLKLHPGEAAFPGGKKDPEDSSLLYTALREANEEVGLLADNVEYIGQLNQRLTRSAIRVSPYVGLVSSEVQLTPNLNELDCIYRLPLGFLLDTANVNYEQVLYQGRLIQVPYFVYRHHRVTGMTALVLMDLMNTGFDAGLSSEFLV